MASDRLGRFDQHFLQGSLLLCGKSLNDFVLHALEGVEILDQRNGFGQNIYIILPLSRDLTLDKSSFHKAC